MEMLEAIESLVSELNELCYHYAPAENGIVWEPFEFSGNGGEYVINSFGLPLWRSVDEPCAAEELRCLVLGNLLNQLSAVKEVVDFLLPNLTTQLGASNASEEEKSSQESSQTS